MKREYAYTLSAILLWSTMATVSKLLLGSLDSMLVLFYTCLFSTIALFFINLANGKLKQLKNISMHVFMKMISIGSLGVFFYNLFYFMGTSRLPAQQAFVINDLWPALIIVFSCIFLHEKCTLGKFFAIFMSFFGVIIITMNGHADFLKYSSLYGILFCLLDAISYAAFSVLNKREKYDNDLAVFVSYAFGTLLSLIFLLLRGNLIIPTKLNLLGLAYNGIFCNAIPYLFWVLALAKGNTAIISNLAYLTPCLSLFVTHFGLGEEITIYSILGLVVIITGIVFQFHCQKKEIS